jgi:hypothetical protein
LSVELDSLAKEIAEEQVVAYKFYEPIFDDTRRALQGRRCQNQATARAQRVRYDVRLEGQTKMIVSLFQIGRQHLCLAVSLAKRSVSPLDPVNEHSPMPDAPVGWRQRYEVFAQAPERLVRGRAAMQRR